MYLYNNPQSVAHGHNFGKVGRVALSRSNQSIRLRWALNNKTYSLSLKGLDKDHLKAAIAKAQAIDSDITFERFDPTLIKYTPLKTTVLETVTVQQVPNLLDLWEQYKKANAHRIAKTTQKHCWHIVDSVLAKLSTQTLKLENSALLVPELLKHFSQGTLERVAIDLNACLSWALKQGIIKSKPNYCFEFNRTKSDRSKKTFTREEIYRIIQAFEQDELKSKNSIITHSHYAQFIMILALTGRRPEDIIALTWDDIINHNGRKVIRFNKAYSKGILKSTKNNTVTLFPVNKQIEDCLEEQGKRDNPNSLIFPSHEMKYIDLHNFTNRHWRPIVKKLVEVGEIREYLPLYNLRHSRATQLIRSGVDLQSIATLLETSIEMLSKHYLEGDSNIDLPEL